MCTEQGASNYSIPAAEDNQQPVYAQVSAHDSQTQSQILRKKQSYHVNVSQSMHPITSEASRISRINFEIELNEKGDADDNHVNASEGDDDAKSVDINLDPKKPVEPTPVHERKDFIWLIICGSVLTFLSGTLNAISFLQTGVTPTHTTGTTTKIGTDAYFGREDSGLDRLLLLGAFFLGTIVSGTGMGSDKFVMGHKYGIFVVFIGLMVIGGTILVREGEHTAGVTFWAGASGMQNAMYTAFSGAVVRTTHVTGTLSDIGNVTGHWLRSKLHQGSTAAAWKLTVLIPLYLAFFCGGLAGAGLSDAVGADGGFIVGGLLLALGVVYMIMGACGLFDGFLEDEIIEKEMEVVEQQFHEALHKAYHAEKESHGVLSRQPSHHSMPQIQAHLHPIRRHESRGSHVSANASHHSHHSHHLHDKE